jgi:hypothetical protein
MRKDDRVVTQENGSVSATPHELCFHTIGLGNSHNTNLANAIFKEVL